MAVSDIRKWLKSLGLGQYATTFAQYDIDGALLAELTDADLEKIGVTSLGHRKKLLKAIGSHDKLGGRSAAHGYPPQQPTPASYTPKHLADQILGVRGALEGERKQVTVLFADVKSSMELSEDLDPETWHRILERFFEVLAEGVHRFEGTINQYTGDGIMALFGAPISHEDHPQRACYAALWLRDALETCAREVKREFGLGLATRIGLHSGEVVVGKIGDDLRMDYTAQGHTVGLAQRMEALAEAGKALLAAHTLDLVEGYFELRDLGEMRCEDKQTSCAWSAG